MPAPKCDRELVAAARAACETRYSTTLKPCKKCGGVVRKCANGSCISCAKEYGASPEGKLAQKTYDARRNANPDRKRKRKLREDRPGRKECINAFNAEVVTMPCPKCGHDLAASRTVHRKLANPNSPTKYCQHCRPDHLESLRPGAPCWLYVVELDGRHGERTGFGVTGRPSVRWKEHRRKLREAGVEIVSDVWLSAKTTRTKAQEVESQIKRAMVGVEGIPVDGFKTESLLGHRKSDVIRLIIDQITGSP